MSGWVLKGGCTGSSEYTIHLSKFHFVGNHMSRLINEHLERLLYIVRLLCFGLQSTYRHIFLFHKTVYFYVNLIVIFCFFKLINKANKIYVIIV